MAKLALINRDLKRRKTVAKYAVQRAALVEIMTDLQISEKLISKDIQMLLYGLFSIVIAMVAGIIISSLIPPPMGGFVLYSRKSEEEYEATLNEERQSLRNIVIAFIGAVCVGIISNYLYAFLTRP